MSKFGSPRLHRSKKAVVTGCAGFIGAHLTTRLLEDGWHVTGVDAIRPYYEPAEKLASVASFMDHPAFRLVVDDIVGLDLHALLQERPHVFHLAAQPGVRGSFGLTFDQYIHDNVMATQRLFEAALECDVPRVVYASSSSVYGDARAYPCVEGTTVPSPRSPYGVTKLTCESLAEVYRSLGLDAVGLRYFTVYGPGQRPDMAMRRLCEAALGGPLFQLFGDGLQSRDFTHVSDVVDATIRSATASNPAPLMNIGGGQEATLREVIDIIASLARRDITIEHGSVQRGDVRRTGADTTLARTTLGWAPKISLMKGLATEFDWVRNLRSKRDESQSAFATASPVFADLP